jgi:acyl-CoA synthetase (AMP-forming)/AMP-acid ligase II
MTQAAVKSFDGRCELSYEDLDRGARAFAGVLASRGCRKGDRVALPFGNTPEFFVALLGCFRGGFIAVPLDSSLAPRELQAILEHSKPALIVSPEDVFRASDAESLIEPPEPDDLALILYTSGSTGTPKGVAHSHRALNAKTAAIRQWFGFDATFTSLCLLPTHFGHGLICNCLATFHYGGTLVIAPPFDLDLLKQLWEIVERHRVNTFSSVPTVVRLLVERARRRGVTTPSSLKWVTCASAPLWREDIEAFESLFHVPLLNCYGLTETAGWSACSPNHQSRNRDSVGLPLGCEFRVGEGGELQIKSPSIMTNAVLNDGWFATGDVGEIDSTGAVLVHSRIKDLIIRAGKNIYPAEVDSVLMSHPEVADACTVGLDDRLLGEKVAACVVRAADSSLGEPGLIEYTRRKLAAYKCPQQIAFVDRIPKTSRGKVNRSNLKTFFEGR